MVKEFVQKKGAGMSYPVAYTGEGSAFETEWLEAAGVEAIPFAFVVRNGKLLLSTEASRLTDSLVETMLSGDDGASQAAAKIKAAYDARDKTDKLIEQFSAARRKKDADVMAEKIRELEALDASHPELPTLKLELLMAREEWPAAIAALGEMPASYFKSAYLMKTARLIAHGRLRECPTSFVRTVTVPYSEYIASKGKVIGPNHFAYLSILHWKIGDKDAAVTYADKGVDVAINFARASEYRTAAFRRFAKLVKEGTMPEFSELTGWQIKARKEAEAREKAAQAKDIE